MSIMDFLPQAEMQVPISGTRGINAAPPVCGNYLTAVCPRCGKEFASNKQMTAYRVTMQTRAGNSKRLLCSYGCVREWEKENEKPDNTGDKVEKLRRQIAEGEALMKSAEWKSMTPKARNAASSRLRWRRQRLEELEGERL